MRNRGVIHIEELWAAERGTERCGSDEWRVLYGDECDHDDDVLVRERSGVAVEKK